MKRLICVVIAISLLVSCTNFCYAQDDITVLINNYPIEFDVPPQIVDGRTLVPVRKIFESLGAKVQWLDEMQLVLATYKTTIIAMPIGEHSFTVTDVVTNETRTVELDVPPQIIDSRTLVPVRAISEAMGKTVDWDGETRTVRVTGDVRTTP